MRRLILTVLLGFCTACAIASNNPRDNYNLGVQYWFGQTLKQNPKTACDYFQKAANLDHPLAQFNLANCYRLGQGRNKNMDTAIHWYKKALSNNVPEAMSTLAAIYLFDVKPSQNDETLRLLDKAIEMEHKNAFFLMGFVCKANIKPNCEVKQAISYYEKAAQKAHLLAQVALSEIYRTGQYGVAINKNRSKYWKEVFVFTRNLYKKTDLNFEIGVKELEKKGFLKPLN